MTESTAVELTDDPQKKEATMPTDPATHDDLRRKGATPLGLYELLAR